MTIASPEAPATRLWYPKGPNLDEEYPNASNTELVELWSEYNPGLEIWPAQAVYGVYSSPDRSIKAIASIDVCEVLRDTAISFRQVVGLEPHRTYDYAQNSWITRDEPPAYERQIVTDTLRLLMSQGKVPPVEYNDGIAAILRGWRRQGVYITANTSTLPGCEAGTIKYSLGRDYPGSFDAIIFPRNHDNRGSITKAGALAILAEEAGLPAQEVPVIHIDDAPHHIKSFLDQPAPFPGVQVFIPEHDSNGGLDPELYYQTPLDAFLAANQHLKSQGVIA